MKEEYVAIAEFTPDHRSAEALQRSIAELDSVLGGRGIEFGLDGSRAYRVIVRSDQVDTARQLLREAHLKCGGKVSVY